MKSKLLLIILTAFLCLHSKAETTSKAAPKTPKIKVACVGTVSYTHLTLPTT